MFFEKNTVSFRKAWSKESLVEWCHYRSESNKHILEKIHDLKNLLKTVFAVICNVMQYKLA
jgi:hypothetical protein